MEETTCFQNKKCGTSCNAFSHMMLRILADVPSLRRGHSMSGIAMRGTRNPTGFHAAILSARHAPQRTCQLTNHRQLDMFASPSLADGHTTEFETLHNRRPTGLPSNERNAREDICRLSLHHCAVRARDVPRPWPTATKWGKYSRKGVLNYEKHSVSQ